MRTYLALIAITAFSFPLIAMAAPIHFRLVGEVESLYTRSGFVLPSTIGIHTTVSVDLVFEPLVLAPKGSTQPSDVLVPTFDLIGPNPIGSGSAKIELVEGYISLASERLQLTGGNLLVSDNKTGGLCAGFSCSTWQDDVIQVLGFGDAVALGDNVRFFTSGGLLSRASGFNIPSTLDIGTDLADLSIWNSFPDSSFYIRFRSQNGSNLGGVEIRLTETVAVPEPLTSTLFLVSVALQLGIRSSYTTANRRTKRST